MRRLRWLIPLVMLLMLAAIIAAPFTATGTRLVIAAANSVPGLSVQHGSGNLMGDLELVSVRYLAGSVEIEVAIYRPGLIAAACGRAAFVLIA